MKGQVSTELLIIIGLILLVFIPLLTLVYFKANDSTQQIASYQTELAVFRIAYLANSVGALGTDTTVFTDVYVPSNVDSFRAEPTGTGGEIVMTINTPQGKSDVVEVVRYPITGTVSIIGNQGGWIRIKISSVYNNGAPSIAISQVK